MPGCTWESFCIGQKEHSYCTDIILSISYDTTIRANTALLLLLYCVLCLLDYIFRALDDRDLRDNSFHSYPCQKRLPSFHAPLAAREHPSVATLPGASDLLMVWPMVVRSNSCSAMLVFLWDTINTLQQVIQIPRVKCDCRELLKMRQRRSRVDSHCHPTGSSFWPAQP